MYKTMVIIHFLKIECTNLERLVLPPFHRFPLDQQVRFHPKLNKYKYRILYIITILIIFFLTNILIINKIKEYST